MCGTKHSEARVYACKVCKHDNKTQTLNAWDVQDNIVLISEIIQYCC